MPVSLRGTATWKTDVATINTSSLPISTFLSLVVFLFLFFFFSCAIITFAVPHTVSIVAFAVFFVYLS